LQLGRRGQLHPTDARPRLRQRAPPGLGPALAQRGGFPEPVLMAGPAMVEVDPASISPDTAYKLLVGAVVPRPIAWVTTLAETGPVNLAPFSCFTFVCSEPPMLAVSIGRLNGQQKDTPRNIDATGEFVVHIADEGHVGQIHESSTEFPPEVSEVEHLG